MLTLQVSDPLEYEPDVGIKLIELNEDICNVDALILPGTRNTISDLVAVREAGLLDEICNISREIPVFGLCGGYQMLGSKIIDNSFKESKYGTVDGLGLLDAKTIFGDESKIITQSQGELMGNGIFKSLKGELINGYELHEGTTILNESKPFLRIIKGCGNHPKSHYDGAVNGYVTGSYFHGLFHNFRLRRFFTDYLRLEKGLDSLGFIKDDFKDIKKFSIDRLAEIFENNVDIEFINRILE